MDSLLTERLERSKSIRGDLEKKGFHLPIPWSEVERAMIYNHHTYGVAPEVLDWEVLGRNDLCLCGSENKYKKCCILKHK